MRAYHPILVPLIIALLVCGSVAIGAATHQAGTTVLSPQARPSAGAPACMRSTADYRARWIVQAENGQVLGAADGFSCTSWDDAYVQALNQDASLRLANRAESLVDTHTP